MRLFLPVGLVLAGLLAWLMGYPGQPGHLDAGGYWIPASLLATLALVAIGTCVDLTVRWRLHRRESAREHELEMTRRLLKESEASRAALAQCLLEPVRVMKALLDSTVRPREAGAASNEMRELITNLDALGERVANIGDMARLSAGTFKVTLSSVDLGAILRDCEKLFHPAAARARLDLVVSPATAWVRTDPVVLRRILENLLHNALKFTASGVVAISCKADDGEVSITVRDTGVGMDPHEVDRLFSSSGHACPARWDTPAKGLGLQVVQRLAGLLGHRLSVRSTKGKGSDFSITLQQVQGSNAGLAGGRR